MVHRLMVRGYVTSYVFFCTALRFSSLLKSKHGADYMLHNAHWLGPIMSKPDYHWSLYGWALEGVWTFGSKLSFLGALVKPKGMLGDIKPILG